MTLARWEPFRDFMSLRQAMDRLFEEAWVHPARLFGLGTEEVRVPVDVAEDEHSIVLRAALPGVRPEDIDLSITGNVLTLQGELRQEEEEKQRNWLYRGIRYGRFHRRIPLPAEVEPERAETSYEYGVLTVRLPKAEAARSKRIQVRSQEPALASSAR